MAVGGKVLQVRQQAEVGLLNLQTEARGLRGIDQRVVLVEAGENADGRIERLLRLLSLTERVAFDSEQQVPANSA